MLKALNHPQHITPVKTDNKTAAAFINNTLKEKQSKSWDMRYFWLKDRITQQQFFIFWDKGSNNHGDYWTKHWSPSYHQAIRPTYILKGCNVSFTCNISSSDYLQGCVENSSPRTLIE